MPLFMMRNSFSANMRQPMTSHVARRRRAVTLRIDLSETHAAIVET
jgi:hypothetical protein